MTESELTQLLSEAFPGAQVSVALEGGHVDISVALEGGHVNITVVSAEFEGLRPVVRQQRVYAPLAGLIADGTLHAVNISAQIP